VTDWAELTGTCLCYVRGHRNHRSKEPTNAAVIFICYELKLTASPFTITYRCVTFCDLVMQLQTGSPIVWPEVSSLVGFGQAHGYIWITNNRVP